FLNDRSGLAVRSQFRSRRASGSKPDSPNDPPCMSPIARHAVAKCPPVAVVWKWKFGEGKLEVLNFNFHANLHNHYNLGLLGLRNLDQGNMKIWLCVDI
ncbi:hypothetical protein AVEN_201738-1, partial [Araneus ventricosus]